MAAVLACGDGAALSHRSAAELWRMLPPADGVPHVTIPTYAGRRRRAGIRVHRSPSLTLAATRRDRVPVTTPARTIADLRTVSAPRELRRAIRQADYLGLPLGASVCSDRTRSELERGFLALCRRHQLPLPEVNVPVDGFTVDFLWREQKLVVETDGYAAHRGRQAFEDDRARDNCLVAHGYTILRFTEQQMDDDPATVARTVRRQHALAL